ncbi:hypothetical protein Aperf_G00000039834 [Anoplocephala perfoliata]
MSIYQSTSNSGQSNNNSNANGQSVDSNPKNDLTLDYLASVYASNGTIPPNMLRQQPAVSTMAQNSAGDIMNALITAAASATSMDPLTASTLLSSLIYTQQQQQQQNSLLQSSIRQAQADLYFTKASPPIDPTLFAQHALLQAGFEASNRQHQQNHHQHQQQQMALAMANLLGQGSPNSLLALQQRRDLYGEEAGTSSSAAGTDESFSSVLAKLTQGLNQSSSATSTTASSTSSRTPVASQGQVRDTLPHMPSPSPSNAPRYSLHSGAEAATAVYTAAAALTALQQQQNRLTTQKHQTPSVSPRSTTVGSTAAREGQPHRGRGRPPKSSISMTKVQVDKQSRASTSTPQSESSAADSNSIDGTITDVLKRLNDSSDQSTNRKRRRLDGVDKNTSNSVSTSASGSNTTSMPALTTKTDSLGHKRARTFAENGYRLPLNLGWRRETLVKGVGPGGLLGDVVYISPCGRQFWNIENIREYLRSTANTILTTEDFSFKSYVRLGDYYECNKDSKGFVKMSNSAVNALIAAGQESPTGSHRRTPQAVYPSIPPSSTSAVPSVSTSNSSTIGKAASGGNFNADLMAAMAAVSAETYAKTFAELALGLPHFPNLSSQVTSALANQAGSLWSPWTGGLPGVVTSTAPTSSTSAFPFQSSHQQQHQQPKQRLSLPSLTNSLEDFNDFRAFFKKLVEDHQRIEKEKESLRKADLEAQNAKAREERIAYLVDEELRRPVEDLNLLNSQPLPTFDRIDGNRMPCQVFTDCIFVLEFLHAFTEVLCIDPESIPTMRCLQAAFIDRDETCLEVVNHLIIELLKFAILDPGIPTPRLVTQLLNQRFSEMEVNTHTVTGLLRVFLIGRNGYEDEMSDWLAPANVDHLTDLSGPQLASLLAFICDELACSSRIISNEVDRTIELQISLRRDKFNLEAKIRKIRIILARKFGLDHTVKSKEENNQKLPAFLHNIRQQISLQNYDSDEEEELDSVEELEKRIENLQHCLEIKQRAIEECTFRLSGVFLGQDRFHRNYFVLGGVGGIYIEGQPTTAREGSSVKEVPPVYDADAIVAEIRARRELSVIRHFNTNPGNSSNNSSNVALKSASVRSVPKVEKPSLEHDKEADLRPEDQADIKNEVIDEEKASQDEKLAEVEESVVEKSFEESNKVEDKDCAESGEITQKSTFPEPEDKNSEKVEDLEESLTSQPLDLSTRRTTPPPSPKPPTPVPPPPPPQESDQTIWQSLTEQDLGAALEACQIDDTFLMTATLLFATQNDVIDRSSMINSWSDPNWHFQLFFYKLYLMKSIAFERRKRSDEDENSLTQSLKLLKTWLAESGLETREDGRHPVTMDVHLNEEELVGEVEKILIERGIQKTGPEDLKSIPPEVKNDWWRASGSEGLQKLLVSLQPRGIRERSLAQTIQMAEEAVTSSIYVDASSVVDLGSTSPGDGWKPSLLRVRSRRGKGRGANANTTTSCFNASNTGASYSVNISPLSHSNRHLPPASNPSEIAEVDAYTFRGDADASPTFTLERSVFLGENFERAMRAGRGSDYAQQTESEREFADECRFLELVEGLVDRVLSASLQMKGWQAPMKATEDDSIQVVPRNAPKVYRYDYWPLELARERLLDLEAHTERRYLLPPLNCESRLDAVQAQAAAVISDEATTASTPAGQSQVIALEGNGSVCSDSTNQEESQLPSAQIRKRSLQRKCDTGEGGSEEVEGRLDAQGLTLWRRNTRKAGSIAELKRCAMQFEAAIAWDKSIMKVLCQICRRDKNEARLLLCDGCDHGFHTYCFRPPMIAIPEGDWFCYDCVSKATGKCHCFVCGVTHPIVENPAEGTSLGNVEPAHRLVQCVSCSRGVHPACLRPPVNRLPKRWTCMLCTVNGVHGGSREKSNFSVGSASAPSTESEANSLKKSQANPIHPERTKRIYIKSGAYCSAKRICRINKSEPAKSRTGYSSAASERKVGRPKGTKRSLKKRGRPSSYYKRVHTDADTVEENESDGDLDEEITDGEYLDDIEEGCGDKEIVGGSGDDVGEIVDSTLANGVPKSKRNPVAAGVKRPRGTRKKRMDAIDIEFCRNATEDLIKHELSWPFRKPVCCKTVPIYRKIIKRPMDLSTILKRLVLERSHHYSSVSEWRKDVRQIFINCRIFNEDDSEIGKAGHELRKYFESTWAHAFLSSNSGEPSLPEASMCEESMATAPSSPECHDSLSPLGKPGASEADDNSSILAEASTVPPSTECEEASASPKCNEPAMEEEVGKSDSPRAGEETIAESVIDNRLLHNAQTDTFPNSFPFPPSIQCVQFPDLLIVFVSALFALISVLLCSSLFLLKPLLFLSTAIALLHAIADID